jgi:hypothetical protein
MKSTGRASASRKALRLMALACLWGATGQVLAQAIVSPVSATTNMGQTYPLANAYNHTGLLTNFTSGVTDFNAYVAGNPQHDSQPGTDWAATTPIGVADFDLGSVKNVNRVAIWNFGGLAGNITYAIKQVSLESSVDSSFSSPAILGTYNLGVYSTTNPGQVFSFPTVAARYFRLYDFQSNGAPSIGLGEIAFATVIPEPASPILVGFAAFGALAALRRDTARRLIR